MKNLLIALAGIAVIAAGTTALMETTAAPPPSPPAADLVAPNISIAHDGAQLTIAFRGTLQSAPAVTGPWDDVLGATTPHRPEAADFHRFYRTRTPDSIFSTSSVVAFTLTGPFQTNFNLAFAGSPDGIFPPVRKKPYFDGSLAIAGYDVPVSLRVRGNSSLQECPFPKLKLKVSQEHREGTPFMDAREVKIGTHCAEGGRGTIGRLREQLAAFREALAYETMGVLGFTSPRVRRAHVNYHDTTPPAEPPDTGWTLDRDALILDDVEVVAARVGGVALDDEELPALTSANFDAQLLTDLQLLHALLGNWDYGLFNDDKGLWNTEVIKLADGKFLPVAGDFDLASWVTGFVRSRAPHDYHPELPDVERTALYDLEQINKRVGAASFAAARDRFVARRSAVELQVAGSLIDEPGRSNCLRHVTAFYDALSPEGR